MRDPCAVRSDTRGSPLRNLVLLATNLVFGFAPLAAAAAAAGAGAGSGEAPSGFERTINVGANTLELRLQHASLAGEGSVATQLPGEGHLTLRLPYVVGQIPMVGNAQVAASYDLAKESHLLPNIAVVARVDLPTAPGMHGARPGVRASAAKRLGPGVFETIRVESELWTGGPSLAPSYRAAIGTTLRLRAATSGSVDLVAVRPGAGTGGASENLAQLGLEHRLDPHTSLHLGIAAGLADGASPFRATFGIERRF